jgi:hypothetical protein
MNATIDLLKQGRKDEVWDRYCGFIDLSLDDFMDVQKRLLMEQIDLLAGCQLGRKLLGDKVPRSVEEFRAQVPLTTYTDYSEHLLEKNEEVLPVVPRLWVHTSGRSGEYAHKWVPYSEGLFQKMGKSCLAGVLFCTCAGKGNVVLEEGDKTLTLTAPMPYVSGLVVRAMEEEFPFDFMPPVEEADQMEFQDRIAKGMNLSLRKGLDVFWGISSILVRVGQSFSERSGNSGISREMLHPAILGRIIRGMLAARMGGRPMLPRDLWSIKGLMTGGMDSSIYADVIEYYWGARPLEFYAGTEFGVMALQTWDFKDLVFLPDVNFLEFIPEDEHLKSKEDPQYVPKTLLLDEVTPGNYETVITNFKGGIFVRYRAGDMIRITARRNDELDIDIPQMVFESRCDDVIDLASFTRLTEKVIWRAIEESEVAYTDWTARKEWTGTEALSDHPILHIYLEPKDGCTQSESEVAELIHRPLMELDNDYRNMVEMIDLYPLRVSFLNPGAFQKYTQDQMAAGADLAHMKPPHMRPSDDVIHRLVSFNV